jgi:D-alanyl-D-alanine carboxypeptidase (penicillin-binding protein 5/6)
MAALCWLLLVTVNTLFVPALAQSPLETRAKQAILIDVTTGETLLEKNADQLMPTSSMSKVMTMYAVFTRIKNGELGLDDRLPVSEKAWRMGGSKMFVEYGNDIRVEDLIQGVIVQSGNDATIVLAEGLAGSETAFADELNRLAADLGMENSQFRNASGWPAEGHYSTARDLAKLAVTIINDFPDFYQYYSQTEFTYHDIRQTNRNPLLYRNVGADGLKTGHTQAAGYGLIGSAARDERRLVLVLNGLESVHARAEEAVRLLEYGFREFRLLTPFNAGDTVGEAQTWLGATPTVPIVVKDKVQLVVPRSVADRLTGRLHIIEPIAAPITKGTTIGRLELLDEDRTLKQVPVYIGVTVERQGVVTRMGSTLHYLIRSMLTGG